LGFSAQFSRNETLVWLELFGMPKIHEKETKGMFHDTVRPRNSMQTPNYGDLPYFWT
jgi:hypothetical protein